MVPRSSVPHPLKAFGAGEHAGARIGHQVVWEAVGGDPSNARYAKGGIPVRLLGVTAWLPREGFGRPTGPLQARPSLDGCLFGEQRDTAQGPGRYATLTLEHSHAVQDSRADTPWSPSPS